jgi:UDPglucose 6-dehydrogenase
VVVGTSRPADRERVRELLAPFTDRVEWMSVESAEMTKHAINAFLATSVTFANEVARLCEAAGADAKEVERGLRSESRIGARAYVSPGAAFAGGTLARDVRFLIAHGAAHQVGTPLLQGAWASNDLHKGWVREQVQRLLGEASEGTPVVAVLGLTYKPGTSTLRRSAAVELCRWLRERGARVRAHDPGVTHLPEELCEVIEWADTPLAALAGADLAVLATEWPQFRSLGPADLSAQMRQPRVIDPTHFLAGTLGAGPGITYVATGKAA